MFRLILRGTVPYNFQFYGAFFKLIFYLNIFCGDKSLFFWGVTGTLCFRLHLTLPMGFKARVDAPLFELCSQLRVMILRVNSESNAEFISCSRILLCNRHHLDWNPQMCDSKSYAITTRPRFFKLI